MPVNKCGRWFEFYVFHAGASLQTIMSLLFNDVHQARLWLLFATLSAATSLPSYVAWAQMNLHQLPDASHLRLVSHLLFSRTPHRGGDVTDAALAFTMPFACLLVRARILWSHRGIRASVNGSQTMQPGSKSYLAPVLLRTLGRAAASAAVIGVPISTYLVAGAALALVLNLI